MSAPTPEEKVRAHLRRLAEHAHTDPATREAPLVSVAPRRPRPTWTLGAAALLLVGALIGAATVRSDGPRGVTAAGELGTLAGGVTDRLADSGLDGRSGAASAWTGKELLVWGGLTLKGSVNEWLADGAALDPVANRWRPVPPAPIGARSYAAAVWTGSEMLVAGGQGGGGPLLDGAAFNPNTNRWRLIAPQPVPGVFRPSAIWTGEEMLVVNSVNGLSTSAYNPRTDRWRELATPPGAPVMPYPQAVWTGKEAVLVLWPSGPRGIGIGSPAPPSPPPSSAEPSQPPLTIATPSPPGTPPPPPVIPASPPTGPNSNMFLASYSPATDQWTRLPDIKLKDNGLPRLAWTGKEVLVLQDSLPGAAYEPRRQAWRSIAAVPKLDEQAFADSPVWTGHLVLLWSGGVHGLAYDPAGDSWATFDAGGLRPRSSSVLAWTDGALVGWSGFNNYDNGSGRLEVDGIRYRTPG